jgi:hypothetical protein
MGNADGPTFHDHQASQAKAGTVATFAFGADELKYTVADKTSSTTFKTPYTALSRDHGYLVERNTWLMNVGLLWMALGALLTAVKFTQTREMVPSLWLWVGLGCAGWAWLRTVRYLKIPAANGTLLIIEDGQKAALLAELDGRRMDQLRRWHDFIDANDDLARQRTRFNWLHEEGALNEDELGERLGRLDRLVAAPAPAVEVTVPGDRVPGSSLN